MTLTQSYDIYVPDAEDDETEIKSISELREYIKSISSQLEPDLTHMVEITRKWDILMKNGDRVPVRIRGDWNSFTHFAFFIVNGKISNVSEVSEYLKSIGCTVYPEKENMRQNALAYHDIGFIPNLCLLENNIVTDMNLNQIRPHATGQEPAALLRFFAPIKINKCLNLR